VLARLVPESFIMMYPSEAASRVVIIPPEQSYEEALEQMLGESFADDPERGRAIRQLVLRNSGPTSEIRPGVVVPHARLAGLDHPVLFLGLSHEGLEFPGATAPARLIFLLLTREDRPEEHLAHLAAVARTVSDPERLARMAAAEDAETLLESARIG
jgi:mannitol/fructose-specific phosphotransferase system IIA component (Ntr-type)